MKYISVQVNLKSHNLFSTGAVPNKGFFFKQKDVIKEMKFTTNVWVPLNEKTLALLKNTLNIFNNKTKENFHSIYF